MRKMLLITVLLSLTGCATMRGGFGAVGAEMCKNREALFASYSLTITNAALIKDPVARAAVIGSAQAQIDALKLCDQTGGT